MHENHTSAGIYAEVAIPSRIALGDAVDVG
jgi:hypothetical protein